MIITIYDIASPYSFIGEFDLGTPECYSEYDYSGDYCLGVASDENKVYAVNRDTQNIARMDKTSLLGDLLEGVWNGEESGMPTYCAVIEYLAAPEVAAENTFGNVIW